MSQSSETDCGDCRDGSMSCPKKHRICINCSFSACWICVKESGLRCGSCKEGINARFVHSEGCPSVYCLSCWRYEIDKKRSENKIKMPCGCQVCVKQICNFISKHCYDCEDKLIAKTCRKLRNGYYVNEKCLNAKIMNPELHRVMKEQLVPICSHCNKEFTGEESRIVQVEDYLTCKQCNQERIMKESSRRLEKCPKCGVLSLLTKSPHEDLALCRFCFDRNKLKKCVRCENKIPVSEEACKQCLAELPSVFKKRLFDQSNTTNSGVQINQKATRQPKIVYGKWQAGGQALELDNLKQINIYEILQGNYRRIYMNLADPVIVRNEIRPLESCMKGETTWQIAIKVVLKKDLHRCQFCLILLESIFKQKKQNKDYRICQRCAVVRVEQYKQ